MSYFSVFRYLYCLVLVFLTFCIQTEIRHIEKGLLNFSIYNISTQIIKFNRDWELYYNQLLTSQEIETKKNLPPRYILLHSLWNGFVLDNRSISGEGSVTFCMKLYVPKGSQNLEIKTGVLGTPSKVYINRRFVQNSINKWNKKRSELGFQEVQIGIGIYYRTVSIGVVGILERLDTTVIKDIVNLASRFETMTKKYKEKILFFEIVFERLNEFVQLKFLEIGNTSIRGRQKPLKIYTLRVT